MYTPFFFRLASSTSINIWQLTFQNHCRNNLKIKASIKHRNLQSNKLSVSYLMDQCYSYYINDFYIISKNHLLSIKFVVLSIPRNKQIKSPLKSKRIYDKNVPFLVNNSHLPPMKNRYISEYHGTFKM